MIQNIAIQLCLENLVELNCVNKDNALAILDKWENFNNKNNKDLLIDKLRCAYTNRNNQHFNEAFAKVINEGINGFLIDSIEENLVFNKNIYSNNDTVVTDQQELNWTAVISDFPRIYAEKLSDIIFPPSYFACFSSKCDDSSMWGNYAENHKGVCLIYESSTEENLQMTLGNQTFPIHIQKVNYEKNPIERNFFKSLGRFNLHQIKTWLTGSESVSSIYDEYRTKDWQYNYQNDCNDKDYVKLKAWKHEQEYRLVFQDYLDQLSNNRLIKYDFSSLKGIIFGIKTSIETKKLIIEKLLMHKDEFRNFKFFQAEYDDIKQKIYVREKEYWDIPIQ